MSTSVFAFQYCEIIAYFTEQQELLLEHTGSFTFAFGSIMLFGFVAIIASFLAGPAVKSETIG